MSCKIILGIVLSCRKSVCQGPKSYIGKQVVCPRCGHGFIRVRILSAVIEHRAHRVGFLSVGVERQPHDGPDRGSRPWRLPRWLPCPRVERGCGEREKRRGIKNRSAQKSAWAHEFMVTIKRLLSESYDTSGGRIAVRRQNRSEPKPSRPSVPGCLPRKGTNRVAWLLQLRPEGKTTRCRICRRG
jgi:hypothetical protein